jgi:hypothetical protein
MELGMRRPFGVENMRLIPVREVSANCGSRAYEAENDACREDGFEGGRRGGVVGHGDDRDDGQAAGAQVTWSGFERQRGQ